MVIGFPVYADRLPSISGKIFENIKGNNTLAVVVTSYGNRDYGDALLELKDKMEERGFIVISAAAIIGEHCLNTSIARNRPDKIDKNKIRNYGLNISKKLQEIDNINDLPDLDVKGNYPYPALKDQHTSTGDSNCIQCGRCIQVCPTNARDMKDEGFLEFMKKLEKITEERKEIEVFL